MTAQGETDAFEAVRGDLIRLAYRMTGSRAEAEDIVQDAWFRWHRADTSDVRSPRAWLSRTVARLAIDHLRTARTRRETYVGPWLPEPLLTDEEPDQAPGRSIELAEDVSLALMTVLETLKPEERAAFLLREAFDMDYADLAATLGKSEDACRQMISRARARLRESRPRFEASDDQHRELLIAFQTAAAANDVAALTRLLTPNASFTSDGGGKVRAALRVVTGAEEVAKLTAHLAKQGSAWSRDVIATRLNDRPAFIVTDDEGVAMTYAIDVEDGRIAAVYIMRNPDKLARLKGPALGSA